MKTKLHDQRGYNDKQSTEGNKVRATFFCSQNDFNKNVNKKFG
jgi:hypothetical protein